MNDTIAFIPIRMNSQRVKNKNVRVLKGRPLFCWSLESLDKLGIPVCVYTNSEDILRACLDFTPSNVDFVTRPHHLDSDDAKGIDIYKCFVNGCDSKFNKFLLAHCTSPFVSTETYQKCIDSIGEDYDSAMTVERIQTFCWYKNNPINFIPPRIQTQKLEPVYVETSAAYCFTREIINNGARTSMNPKLIETHYPEILDIDTEEDFTVAENANVR